MHEIVKIAETTVASIAVGAIKLEGRPPGKFFKDQFWERGFIWCYYQQHWHTKQERANHSDCLHKAESHHLYKGRSEHQMGAAVGPRGLQKYKWHGCKGVP